MRRDIEIWWKQALKDYENAELNYKNKQYYLTAFLVQQSVEKALKAYYVHNKGMFSDRTHSLVYLGKELDLPDKLLTLLRKINPDFIFTRYPDMDGVPPYEAYDENIAKERLIQGKEVLEWITKKIKQ
ncbi:MAG: HEPN domain-containing protein [Candidatus Woesearchaeota archaeon]